MWWALQGQPIADVWTRIAAADWWLLGLVGIIFTVQQILRSHRQMRIVRSTSPNHQFSTSFYILCISFFFINILPLRMGEIMRPVLLLEKEDMPMGSGLAVVFVERIIDLISAMVMAILVFIFKSAEGQTVNVIMLFLKAYRQPYLDSHSQYLNHLLQIRRSPKSITCHQRKTCAGSDVI